MVSVKWGAAALENLDTLDPVIRKRILTKVSWFKENVADVVPEKLHLELKGLYKLRVGDYRVVYYVRGKIIFIETVGHRRDVYK